MKLRGIPFTQVANSVLNDPNLSWKAKGIFAYIYSKPEDWDYSTDRMARDASDGLDSLYSGIKDLEKFGYLVRHRLSSGKMEYTVTYQPKTEKASLGNSLAGKNGPLSNKEQLTNKEDKQISYAVPSETARLPKRDPNELLPGMSELVDELDRDKRKHIGIIALYLDYRKKFLAPKLKTRGQLNQFIRRHIRAASALTAYDESQIQSAFKAVERKYKDIDWSLETILKELTK